MKRKVLTVLSVILGLLLMNSGLYKFLNYMPVPEDLHEGLARDFEAIEEITWLMPLIGLAELVGGFLILFPKTRALGVLIVFPVMVGVALTHIFVDPSGLIIAGLIWAILGWIIYDNREKYLPIVR